MQSSHGANEDWSWVLYFGVTGCHSFKAFQRNLIMKYIIALLLLFSSCSTTEPNKPDFLKESPPPVDPCWKFEPDKVKESDFLNDPNKYNLLFEDKVARKPFIFDKDDKDFC